MSEQFFCEVCNRTFKTKRGWQIHMVSRNHLENLAIADKSDDEEVALLREFVHLHYPQNENGDYYCAGNPTIQAVLDKINARLREEM